MGYVEKRGKASWRLHTTFSTDQGRQPVAMTIRMDPSLPESVQRRDAERELANLEKRLGAERSTAFTLRAWSEEWIRKHVAPDASPVTVSNYRFLLDSRILPLLGDYLLTDLTPAILTNWLMTIRADPRKTTRKPAAALSRDRRQNEEAALISPRKQRRPLSPKTLQNYYGCLSALLTTAVRMGYLESNPLDRVPRPKRKHQQHDILTESQAVELIRTLQQLPPEQHCFVLAVLLALLCSLRLGEVCALRYSDVDFRAGTLRITKAVKYTSDAGAFTAAPKTDSAIRTVTLPTYMLEQLQRGLDLDTEEWIDMGIEDDAAGRPHRHAGVRLIVHGRWGRPVNKDTPSKWFHRFARAHGYDITFHDLRHVHASILVAHGVDVAAVASRMGHSNAAVTLSTYTHPFAAQDQLAAQVLDSVITPAAPPADPPAASPPADPPAEDPS